MSELSPCLLSQSQGVFFFFIFTTHLLKKLVMSPPTPSSSPLGRPFQKLMEVTARGFYLTFWFCFSWLNLIPKVSMEKKIHRF